MTKIRTEAEIEKAIADHVARNGALRKVFIDKGIDLGEPRLIECHFWSWSRETADALALDLTARGFRILAQRPASSPTDSSLWNIEVGIQQSIELTLRREFTDDLVRVSGAHDAIYDGWGTSV